MQVQNPYPGLYKILYNPIFSFFSGCLNVHQGNETTLQVRGRSWARAQQTYLLILIYCHKNHFFLIHFLDHISYSLVNAL